jgi:pyrroline-5-carboxylate reductase
MTASIGIIGVGHLAGYLVEGLKRAADCPEIVLSPRNADKSRTLAGRFGARVAADNAEVVEAADTVILATRPDQAVQAATQLPWRAGQILICVAAGIPLGALAPVAGPATVVRAMPISSAAIGESPTSLYPDHAEARRLLKHLGPVHALPDETSFEAASVLGAFYGWIYAMLAEVTAWTGDQGVPPQTARDLVAQTARGATGMILGRPDESLAAMLETLCTPGGITSRGLEVLEENEAISAWREACRAALERTRENAANAQT